MVWYNSLFDTLNAGNAKNAFERALITWRCNTGVNFRIKDTTHSNTCFINYGPLPAGVTTATKAVTPYGNIDDCATSISNSFQYLTKWDMYFSNAAIWHSDTTKPVINWSTKFDLETVALHELGHAHLLWHTNNPANVMYGLANQYRRALTADDLEGGNYIVGYSTQTATPPCTTYMHMTAINANDCATVGIKDLQNAENFFWVNPNPASEEINIQLKDADSANAVDRIQIYDIAGQMVKTVYPSGNSISIPVTDCKPGLYIVLIESDKQYFAVKFIKH